MDVEDVLPTSTIVSQDTTLETTQMKKNKSQACAETIDSGKECETSIKFSTTDIGNKDEKLPNKDYMFFEELRESKIIDIEYDSNDDDEIEIKVKLRITVHRPQLFSKKTPKELSKGDTKGRDIGEKDFVLISNLISFEASSSSVES